jgi:uncharacterized protein YdaU (DUF1376 family)
LKAKLKIDANELLTNPKLLVLTLAELGCLLKLRCHYWNAGHLPKDPLSLSKLVGCPLGEFKHLWPKLRAYFKLNREGKLICRDLEEAREDALATSQRMRDAANVRWKGEK